MARRSTRAKKNTRSVDFSQEVKFFEADQDYEFEVKSCAWEDGNEHPYLAFVFKGTEDEYEESELYHNASTSPKALFRLRGLLEALGIEIVDGEPMDIDPEELVGLKVMGHTYEDEYRNNDGEKKKTVRCDDWWPVEEKSSKKKGGAKKKDEDDDKPARGKKGASKKKEVEKVDPEALEDMDRDELVDLIEEHSLEVDPDSRKLKKDDALREAVKEALEEADLLEEAAEEEPEPKKRTRGKAAKEDADEGKRGSARGSGKSKKKSTSWSEDELDEMSEDELDEVVETSGVDVDLSEHRTLRKKRNALKDALEEADMIAG